VEEAKGDFNMLLNFGFCATLSVIMFGQYFWYQKNTESFYERQQQKNHEGSDYGAVNLGYGDNGNHKLPPESLVDIQVALENAVCLVEGRATRRRKSGT
jgi:DNA relaxase NicK